MVISYYGLSCFKVQSGELTVAFDPPSKESDLKPPRFETHVALSSHNHPRHNGLKELSGKKPARAGGDGGPFFIFGPGEYEVEGLVINGFPSFHDSEKGKKFGPNAIYLVEMEDLKLCHLGDLGAIDLSAETLETIGQPDVLFIPTGGKDVLDAEAAAKLARELRPKIVIPMHFAGPGSPVKGEKVEEFLEELGEEKTKAEDKFTFKKKELSEDGMKVVVLKSLLG